MPASVIRSFQWLIVLAALPVAANERVPLEGPIRLCAAPAWSADNAKLVAWEQGGRIVLQAARERDVLPSYLFQAAVAPRLAMGRLELVVREGVGFDGSGPRSVLRLGPGLALPCELSHED